MLKPLAVLACAFTLALPAAAQAEPSARALELSRRYIAALHMETVMQSVMAAVIPTTIASLERRHGPLTADMKIALTQASEETALAMTPKMIEVMVPAVAESFSEEELAAAVAYYESPLAQSLIAKTPQYVARVTPGLAELTEFVETEFEARVCDRIDC